MKFQENDFLMLKFIYKKVFKFHIVFQFIFIKSEKLEIRSKKLQVQFIKILGSHYFSIF
jgi:hypothetical protein